MEIMGSCFCSAVQFKLSNAPKAVVNCHCNFCRRHSGSAFATYAVVPEATFEIISGYDSISIFQFKENAHKHFCKQCGTPIFNKNVRYAGLCMVYFGVISDSLNMAPTVNIYCESQLAWVPAIAEIRSFAQGVPKQT